MNKLEQQIIDHLREKYAAEMIILHGSRASELSQDSSDWDLFVFTSADIEGGPEKFDGQHLDVDLVKLPIADDYVLKTFVGPVEAARVLYDQTGLADDLIARTKAAREKGPEKLGERERENRQLRAERFLLRIKKYEGDPMVQYYYAGFFYEIVIRYWFELRQEWALPPYRAIPYIKAHDEAFFEALEKIVEAEDKVEPAREICKMLFNV